MQMDALKIFFLAALLEQKLKVLIRQQLAIEPFDFLWNFESTINTYINQIKLQPVLLKLA